MDTVSKNGVGMDRRQRRTRKLLGDTLMALIAEKGFGDLSIEEICERAGIARRTFYNHFADKHELLWATVESVFDRLADDLNRFDAETLLVNGKPLTYPVFKHVEANAALYRVMLSVDGTAHFILRLMGYLSQVSYEKHAPLRQMARHISVEPTFTAHFLAGAVVNIVIWWLERDLHPPAEAMAYTFSQLAAPGVLEVLGLGN
jgi:AcrR family transcriptional regulator